MGCWKISVRDSKKWNINMYEVFYDLILWTTVRYNFKQAYKEWPHSRYFGFLVSGEGEKADMLQD